MTFTTSLSKHSAGFTLVEILVSMGILALLASLIIPVIGSFQAQSKVAGSRLLINTTKSNIEAFNSELTYYPGAYWKEEDPEDTPRNNLAKRLTYEFTEDELSDYKDAEAAAGDDAADACTLSMVEQYRGTFSDSEWSTQKNSALSLLQKKKRTEAEIAYGIEYFCSPIVDIGSYPRKNIFEFTDEDGNNNIEILDDFAQPLIYACAYHPGVPYNYFHSWKKNGKPIGVDNSGRDVVEPEDLDESDIRIEAPITSAMGFELQSKGRDEAANAIRGDDSNEDNVIIEDL